MEKQAAEGPTPALQKPLPTALLRKRVTPLRPQHPLGSSQQLHSPIRGWTPWDAECVLRVQLWAQVAKGGSRADPAPPHLTPYALH